MREFLDPYDTRLNQYSRQLAVSELSSSAIRSVIDDMYQIARGERDEGQPKKATLVGLSAPQIGEFVRIIMVDTSADPTVPNFTPNLKAFINPRIINTSPDEVLGREGCFSTGQIGGAVYRAATVTIKALDENGEMFTFEPANTFQSAILQHEIDHLNGVRFPSRVRQLEHLHLVEFSDFQNYRDNWRNWQRLCPLEKWLEMYRGEQ